MVGNLTLLSILQKYAQEQATGDRQAGADGNTGEVRKVSYRSKEHVRRSTARWMQGVALGVLAVVTAAPAFAETIETVVVTAERRATDLQKTALSATVLTGEDLKARGIEALDQLQFSTPSLTVQDSGSNVLVNLRGI